MGLIAEWRHQKQKAWEQCSVTGAQGCFFEGREGFERESESESWS
jgi:hypothetical protein